MRLVAGLHPRTRWGSLQRFPRPTSWIKGEGKGEREEGGPGRNEETGGPPQCLKCVDAYTGPYGDLDSNKFQRAFCGIRMLLIRTQNSYCRACNDTL